jgi:ferredoxin/flavodoxin---NADP+ reductase
MSPYRNQAEVIANRMIAPGAFILQFRRTFDFLAGQVVMISTQAESEPRMYSIASGIDQELIDILYTIKPDGILTPQLASLKPGDMIFHSMPYGKFLCDDKPGVWIATGTGIAPFVSMALSGLAVKKMLIYGGRSPDRLYYHDQLHMLLGNKYMACCSREQHEHFFHGRVTDYLQSNTIDTTLPYFLCGSAEMVVDVRDILIARGVPYERIFAEIFF